MKSGIPKGLKACGTYYSVAKGRAKDKVRSKNSQDVSLGQYHSADLKVVDN